MFSPSLAFDAQVSEALAPVANLPETCPGVNARHLWSTRPGFDRWNLDGEKIPKNC
jgi:hypothetical protein